MTGLAIEEGELLRGTLEAVVAGINGSFLLLDRDWRVVCANHGAARLTGMPMEKVPGNSVWEALPGAAGTKFEIELRRAMTERVPIEFECFHAALGRWLEHRVLPAPGGLCIFTADVAEHKDEFLAMLAHELRNPLAPIRNGLEIMRLQRGDPATIESTRQIMERQVEQLVRLVDDLLDVSRITRGQIKLKNEPVDLATIVGTAVETCRATIEARRHRLTVSLPAPLRLEADGVRLTQVLANLLDNAAKYTEPGGDIWLTAESGENEISVRVRDSGIGIPSQMLPHVFDLFTQVGRSLDRSDGGLGIGLTLVRTLVEMHGGRVEAFSAGRGQGSEFVVRLPVACEKGVRPRAPEDFAGRAPAPPSRRVLVVEDNADVAETLAILLRFTGHDVRAAYDGPMALDMVRTFQPEVVLLDIGLPGMDGYAVARSIRQEVQNPNLLLVALTGYGQEEDRRRSKEAGFEYHLVKPVDPGALQVLLGSLMRAAA